MSRSCLADFDILKRLGRGSHGSVFLVRRKQDNRKYCLKQVEFSDLTEFLLIINSVLPNISFSDTMLPDQ